MRSFIVHEKKQIQLNAIEITRVLVVGAKLVEQRAQRPPFVGVAAQMQMRDGRVAVERSRVVSGQLTLKPGPVAGAEAIKEWIETFRKGAVPDPRPWPSNVPP